MASKIAVNLDTSKEIFLNSKCKQNDDLILECNIFENGLALDLTNKEISIQALKADKTYIIQNTDITKENNKFIANLVRDFTRVVGKTEIEVVLIESGRQNTTFSFYLEVVGSVIKGAVGSGDTPTILEVLQKKIVEAGSVKEKTEQLIEKGGAATKGDVQKVSAQLEHCAKKDDVAKISSGTPLFTSSTTEMTDVTKNYVNTTDGYLYIYSNGNWTKTGVKYQEMGLSDGQVTPEKLVSINENLQIGSVESGYRLVNGVIEAVSSYSLTDFIKVEENKKYIVYYARREIVTFFDENKNYLSSINIGVSDIQDYEFITPNNCKYIRLNIYNIYLEGFYLKSEMYDLEWLNVSNNNFKENELSYTKINGITEIETQGYSKVYKNLLENVSITENCYNISGKDISDDEVATHYNLTDFIEVIPNTLCQLSYARKDFLTYYDRNFNFLGKMRTETDQENYSVTIPYAARYIKVNIYREKSDGYQINGCILEKGIVTKGLVEWITLPDKSVTSDMLDDEVFNKIEKYEDTKWINKKCYSFGDSILAQDKKAFAYPSPTYNTDKIGEICIGYQSILENKFGFTNTNFAVGGNTIINQREIILTKDFTGIDLCIIGIGVNDYRTGVKLGNIGTSTDTNYDTSTFYGAYRSSLDYIFTSNPKCKVILMTPLHRNANGFVIDTINSNGNTLTDFSNAIKKLGELYSVPVADMYSNSGLNRFNLPELTFEGVHPTNEGYEFITQELIEVFKKL